ncbi:hypothetical protein Taro_028228 [Colocasia esculenta]|uniref:RING-type domain-containing protein n=1 Tax=Colocasia esculenta TaxID=4460 RepID=A0A843VGQ3_COLES|nr:hypothetical protein [Colocasia esculenta]
MATSSMDTTYPFELTLLVPVFAMVAVALLLCLESLLRRWANDAPMGPVQGPADAAARVAPGELASLPTFLYPAGTASENCVVCLAQFQEDQRVRTLPQCNHCFHVECVDHWLRQYSGTCPLCRSPVVMPPESQLLIDLPLPPGDEPVDDRYGSSSPLSSPVLLTSQSSYILH